MVAQALKTGARGVSPYEHPLVFGLLYSGVQVGAWIAKAKLRQYCTPCKFGILSMPQCPKIRTISPISQQLLHILKSVFRNYLYTTVALCSRLYFDTSVLVERNRMHAVFKRIVTMSHLGLRSTDHVDTWVRSLNILREPQRTSLERHASQSLCHFSAWTAGGRAHLCSDNAIRAHKMLRIMLKDQNELVKIILVVGGPMEP